MKIDVGAVPEAVSVEGRPAQAIFVASERVKNWTIYVDQENHRIVRMDYRDRGMDGSPVEAKVLFEDYRQVDGIWWPYQRRLFHEDTPLATLTVTSLKVNSGLAAEVFKKP